MKAPFEFQTHEQYLGYLRTQFAAMAMQGLLSSMAEKASCGTWDSEHKEVAKVAVKFADELLRQLEP